MIDFGLSKRYGGRERLKSFCGTPDYCAPEILTGAEYDNTIDVWAVGTVFFYPNNKLTN